MICESIERVARRTYYGTRVEHELEQAGVVLLAADEPMTLSRLRATTVLTRRVKQGVAEWYVLSVLPTDEPHHVRSKDRVMTDDNTTRRATTT